MSSSPFIPSPPRSSAHAAARPRQDAQLLPSVSPSSPRRADSRNAGGGVRALSSAPTSPRQANAPLLLPSSTPSHGGKSRSQQASAMLSFRARHSYGMQKLEALRRADTPTRIAFMETMKEAPGAKRIVDLAPPPSPPHAKKGTNAYHASPLHSSYSPDTNARVAMSQEYGVDFNGGGDEEMTSFAGQMDHLMSLSEDDLTASPLPPLSADLAGKRSLRAAANHSYALSSPPPEQLAHSPLHTKSSGPSALLLSPAGSSPQQPPPMSSGPPCFINPSASGPFVLATVGGFGTELIRKSDKQLKRRARQWAKAEREREELEMFEAAGRGTAGTNTATSTTAAATATSVARLLPLGDTKDFSPSPILAGDDSLLPCSPSSSQSPLRASPPPKKMAGPFSIGASSLHSSSMASARATVKKLNSPAASSLANNEGAKSKRRRRTSRVVLRAPDDKDVGDGGETTVEGAQQGKRRGSDSLLIPTKPNESAITAHADPPSQPDDTEPSFFMTNVDLSGIGRSAAEGVGSGRRKEDEEEKESDPLDVASELAEEERPRHDRHRSGHENDVYVDDDMQSSEDGEGSDGSSYAAVWQRTGPKVRLQKKATNASITASIKAARDRRHSALRSLREHFLEKQGEKTEKSVIAIRRRNQAVYGQQWSMQWMVAVVLVRSMVGLLPIPLATAHECMPNGLRRRAAFDSDDDNHADGNRYGGGGGGFGAAISPRSKPTAVAISALSLSSVATMQQNKNAALLTSASSNPFSMMRKGGTTSPRKAALDHYRVYKKTQQEEEEQNKKKKSTNNNLLLLGAEGLTAEPTSSSSAMSQQQKQRLRELRYTVPGGGKGLGGMLIDALGAVAAKHRAAAMEAKKMMQDSADANQEDAKGSVALSASPSSFPSDPLPFLNLTWRGPGGDMRMIKEAVREERVQYALVMQQYEDALSRRQQQLQRLQQEQQQQNGGKGGRIEEEHYAAARFGEGSYIYASSMGNHSVSMLPPPPPIAFTHAGYASIYKSYFTASAHPSNANSVTASTNNATSFPHLFPFGKTAVAGKTSTGAIKQQSGLTFLLPPPSSSSQRGSVVVVEANSHHHHHETARGSGEGRRASSRRVSSSLHAQSSKRFSNSDAHVALNSNEEASASAVPYSVRAWLPFTTIVTLPPAASTALSIAMSNDPQQQQQNASMTLGSQQQHQVNRSRHVMQWNDPSLFIFPAPYNAVHHHHYHKQHHHLHQREHHATVGAGGGGGGAAVDLPLLAPPPADSLALLSHGLYVGPPNVFYGGFLAALLRGRRLRCRQALLYLMARWWRIRTHRRTYRVAHIRFNIILRKNLPHFIDSFRVRRRSLNAPVVIRFLKQYMLAAKVSRAVFIYIRHVRFIQRFVRRRQLVRRLLQHAVLLQWNNVCRDLCYRHRLPAFIKATMPQTVTTATLAAATAKNNPLNSSNYDGGASSSSYGAAFVHNSKSMSHKAPPSFDFTTEAIQDSCFVPIPSTIRDVVIDRLLRHAAAFESAEMECALTTFLQSLARKEAAHQASLDRNGLGGGLGGGGFNMFAAYNSSAAYGGGLSSASFAPPPLPPIVDAAVWCIANEPLLLYHFERKDPCLASAVAKINAHTRRKRAAEAARAKRAAQEARAGVAGAILKRLHAQKTKEAAANAAKSNPLTPPSPPPTTSPNPASTSANKTSSPAAADRQRRSPPPPSSDDDSTAVLEDEDEPLFFSNAEQTAVRKWAIDVFLAAERVKAALRLRVSSRPTTVAAAVTNVVLSAAGGGGGEAENDREGGGAFRRSASIVLRRTNSSASLAAAGPPQAPSPPRAPRPVASPVQAKPRIAPSDISKQRNGGRNSQSSSPSPRGGGVGRSTSVSNNLAKTVSAAAFSASSSAQSNPKSLPFGTLSAQHLVKQHLNPARARVLNTHCVASILAEEAVAEERSAALDTAAAAAAAAATLSPSASPLSKTPPYDAINIGARKTALGKKKGPTASILPLLDPSHAAYRIFKGADAAPALSGKAHALRCLVASRRTIEKLAQATFMSLWAAQRVYCSRLAEIDARVQYVPPPMPTFDNNNNNTNTGGGSNSNSNPSQLSPIVSSSDGSVNSAVAALRAQQQYGVDFIAEGRRQFALQQRSVIEAQFLLGGAAGGPNTTLEATSNTKGGGGNGSKSSFARSSAVTSLSPSSTIRGGGLGATIAALAGTTALPPPSSNARRAKNSPSSPSRRRTSAVNAKKRKEGDGGKGKGTKAQQEEGSAAVTRPKAPNRNTQQLAFVDAEDAGGSDDDDETSDVENHPLSPPATANSNNGATNTSLPPLLARSEEVRVCLSQLFKALHEPSYAVAAWEAFERAVGLALYRQYAEELGRQWSAREVMRRAVEDAVLKADPHIASQYGMLRSGGAAIAARAAINNFGYGGGGGGSSVYVWNGLPFGGTAFNGSPGAQAAVLAWARSLTVLSPPPPSAAAITTTTTQSLQPSAYLNANGGANAWDADDNPSKNTNRDGGRRSLYELSNSISHRYLPSGGDGTSNTFSTVRLEVPLPMLNSSGGGGSSSFSSSSLLNDPTSLKVLTVVAARCYWLQFAFRSVGVFGKGRSGGTMLFDLSALEAATAPAIRGAARQGMMGGGGGGMSRRADRSQSVFFGGDACGDGPFGRSMVMLQPTPPPQPRLSISEENPFDNGDSFSKSFVAFGEGGGGWGERSAVFGSNNSNNNGAFPSSSAAAASSSSASAVNTVVRSARSVKAIDAPIRVPFRVAEAMLRLTAAYNRRAALIKAWAVGGGVMGRGGGGGSVAGSTIGSPSYGGPLSQFYQATPVAHLPPFHPANPYQPHYSTFSFAVNVLPDPPTLSPTTAARKRQQKGMSGKQTAHGSSTLVKIKDREDAIAKGVIGAKVVLHESGGSSGGGLGGVANVTTASVSSNLPLPSPTPPYSPSSSAAVAATADVEPTATFKLLSPAMQRALTAEGDLWADYVVPLNPSTLEVLHAWAPAASFSGAANCAVDTSPSLLTQIMRGRPFGVGGGGGEGGGAGGGGGGGHLAASSFLDGSIGRPPPNMMGRRKSVAMLPSPPPAMASNPSSPYSPPPAMNNSNSTASDTAVILGVVAGMPLNESTPRTVLVDKVVRLSSTATTATTTTMATTHRTVNSTTTKMYSSSSSSAQQQQPAAPAPSAAVCIPNAFFTSAPSASFSATTFTDNQQGASSSSSSAVSLLSPTTVCASAMLLRPLLVQASAEASSAAAVGSDQQQQQSAATASSHLFSSSSPSSPLSSAHSPIIAAVPPLAALEELRRLKHVTNDTAARFKALRYRLREEQLCCVGELFPSTRKRARQLCRRLGLVKESEERRLLRQARLELLKYAGGGVGEEGEGESEDDNDGNADDKASEASAGNQTVLSSAAGEEEAANKKAQAKAAAKAERARRKLAVAAAKRAMVEGSDSSDDELHHFVTGGASAGEGSAVARERRDLFNDPIPKNATATFSGGVGEKANASSSYSSLTSVTPTPRIAQRTCGAVTTNVKHPPMFIDLGFVADVVLEVLTEGAY